MELTNEEIILRFPPCLRQNLLELITVGNAVVSTMRMKINLCPKKVNENNINTGNNFILDIPYAGKRLQWEVLFNDEDHTFAPDFDFINDSFLCDPDYETVNENVPGLSKWDVANPTSLVCVIKQLLTLYKKYQVQKLETDMKFSKLKQEYVFLKHKLDLGDEDIEVYVDNNDSLHFLISLKLDFSSLPVYIQQSYFQGENLLNPGQDSATLRISYGGNRVITYLQLSPRLEYALGDHTVLHIPTYNKDSGMVEYVQEVIKLLENKVDQIEEYFKMKNEYISALLALHNLSMIEYDNISFSKSTFICEVDGFSCIVHISLSNKFPREKPSVRLQSIYRCLSGKSVTKDISDYPYSPRWKPEEMVKRLLKTLPQQYSKFKTVINKN